MRLPRLTSWWSALAALAAVRLAVPLAAYSDSGSALPGLPRWTYRGLEGDATGFYAASREFMAAWGRMPEPLLGVVAVAVVAAAAGIAVAWRRRPDLRAWLVPLAVLAFGLAVCVDVHWMRPSGAAVFGWSLVWGLVMLPYRALGFGLSHRAAWHIGFALSLACVAFTVVAVGYLGRYASGRRSVGLAAAALWAAWPLLVGVVAGHDAWGNGQWDIDVGLHNYDEPLSTLLVTGGAALVLSPRLTPLRLSLAGCVMSVATCVKVSNALLAAAALAIVFLRGRSREALPYLAGALAFAPVVLAYWPLSYPKLFNRPESWPRNAFAASHIVTSWTHSAMFGGYTLAFLLPLAAVGVVGLRRPWATAIVVAFLLLNPIFYSFYANTALHPRFLYASLPELLVLCATGFYVVLGLVTRGRAPVASEAASR